MTLTDRTGRAPVAIAITRRGGGATRRTSGLEIGGTSLQMTANRRARTARLVIAGGSAITPGTRGSICDPLRGAAARLLPARAAGAGSGGAGSGALGIRKDTHVRPADADSAATVVAAADGGTGARADARSKGLTRWTGSMQAALSGADAGRGAAAPAGAVS